MSDITINTNQPNRPIVADTVKKGLDAIESKAAGVKKDDGIVNSKIENDTLTTSSTKQKKETPIITDEMLKNLDKILKEKDTKKTKDKEPAKNPADVIKTAAEKAKEKITHGKDKAEPKNVAEFIQKKKEAKELKKAAKQAKAEQKAQAENAKMSNTKKVVNTQTGKVTNLTVKIVKDENGKWKAERPKTPEFNAFDQYLKNARVEYEKEHPEPKFSADNTNSESAEHAKWNADKKKNDKIIKRDYIRENKAFAEQNAAYVKAQFKAQELNK